MSGVGLRMCEEVVPCASEARPIDVTFTVFSFSRARKKTWPEVAS